MKVSYLCRIMSDDVYLVHHDQSAAMTPGEKIASPQLPSDISQAPGFNVRRRRRSCSRNVILDVIKVKGQDITSMTPGRILATEASFR